MSVEPMPSKGRLTMRRLQTGIRASLQLLRRVYFHGLNATNYIAPLYWDTARFPDDTFLVAGSPRSGTTWVANVIAAATNSRVIFEPFLPTRSGDFALAQPLFRRQKTAPNYPLYVPPAADLAEPRCQQIERILRGGVRRYWSHMGTRPGVFRHRIIKEVRANLYLGFVAENWPALKIMLVLRDPFRTVDSQLERAAKGWEFGWDGVDVLSQTQLLDDWLHPFSATIERAETLVGRLANKWCIETYVGLCQVQGRSNGFPVCYGWLTRNASSWASVQQFLAPRCWSEKAAKKAHGVASFTSYRGVPRIGDQQRQYRMLDRKGECTIARILDEYGLTEFSRELQKGEARCPSWRGQVPIVRPLPVSSASSQ